MPDGLPGATTGRRTVKVGNDWALMTTQPPARTANAPTTMRTLRTAPSFRTLPPPFRERLRGGHFADEMRAVRSLRQQAKKGAPRVGNRNAVIRRERAPKASCTRRERRPPRHGGPRREPDHRCGHSGPAARIASSALDTGQRAKAAPSSAPYE